MDFFYLFNGSLSATHYFWHDPVIDQYTTCRIIMSSLASHKEQSTRDWCDTGRAKNSSFYNKASLLHLALSDQVDNTLDDNCRRRHTTRFQSSRNEFSCIPLSSFALALLLRECRFGKACHREPSRKKRPATR